MQNTKFPLVVQLAGDSIWGYEGPMAVTVHNIVEEGSFDEEEYPNYMHVKVMHDAPWTIYTDSGFEQAISTVLGYEVSFTEQGMQDNGVASMEGELEAECDCYGCTTMRHKCIDEILA